MLKAWSITKSRDRGFSIVEVLLSVTIFGFLVTALIGSLVYGRTSTASAGDHQRATLLAEEGLEATRNIADAAFSNLVDGTYGLHQSNGTWVLSGTSDTSDIYTRQVTVSTVNATSKSIVSAVTWTQSPNIAKNISLTTRITNWRTNLKHWSNAITLSSINLPGTTDGLKVDTSKNYAYLVRNSTTNNFIVIDLSNPASPTIINTSTFPGIPTNIFVSGNYAYVTTNSAVSSLEIIDVSNPAEPLLAKSIGLPGIAASNGIFVSGNYAYVTRNADIIPGASEFNIINISNPISASVVGSYNNNIQMNEIYIAGSYAYIATSSATQEMLVINIANPASPTLTTTYNSTASSTAQTITGYDNNIILGAGNAIDIINIANPASPTRLGTYTSNDSINDIDIDATKQFAFLGTSSNPSEFQIIYIANPANIILVDEINIPGGAALFGIAYDDFNDLVIGASISTTQEFLIFSRN